MRRQRVRFSILVNLQKVQSTDLPSERLNYGNLRGNFEIRTFHEDISFSGIVAR